MSRKKELMEMDSQVMGEGLAAEGQGALPEGMTAQKQDSDITGSDAFADSGDNWWESDDLLNESQSMESEDSAEDDNLPELTEEEMFGEGQSDEIPESENSKIYEEMADSEENAAWDNTEISAETDSMKAEPISVGKETVSEETAPAKPKRVSRKKKTEASAETSAQTEIVLDTAGIEDEEMSQRNETDGNLQAETTADDTDTDVQVDAQIQEELSADNMDSDNGLLPETADLKDGSDSFAGTIGGSGSGHRTAASEEKPAASVSRPVPRARKAEAPVLTLEVRGEVETEESREDIIWHEIHNAYRTRRILTGQLGGIEQTDNGKTIAIVDYKGFRIVIPLKEMMINVGRSPSGQEYTELMLRQNKILGNMLGAEIDFAVKGIDSKSRSVVASRREAMLKKRQIFYMDTDASGMHRIYEGRIVQARVVAVAEKVLRVEIFGVECSIMARDLAWDWIGDAHERFSVGDQVLVKVLNVRRDSLEEIAVKADIKSVSQNTIHDNLKKCRIQSKYAGKVTDVHKGVVYIRLSNGVNAVAHSCYDYRTPGKKDDVSFAVTRLDEERGVAVGIITRIIRQNL